MAFVFFVFLYGIASLLGMGLSAYWGTMATKRAKEIHHPWYQDRYALIAIGVALVAGGQALMDLFRLIGNAHYGLSKILAGPEGIGIAAGLLVILVGFFSMIRLADLEVNPPRWTWTKRAVVLTVFWAMASVIIHLWFPLA